MDVVEIQHVCSDCVCAHLSPQYAIRLLQRFSRKLRKMYGTITTSFSRTQCSTPSMGTQCSTRRTLLPMLLCHF